MGSPDVWFATTPRPAGRLVAAYSSDLHPAGTVVHLPAGADLLSDPSALGVAEVVLVDGRERVSRVRTRREGGAVPPDLWYVLRDDTRSGVPALLLVAFTGGHLRPGAIASPSEAARAGAAPTDRAGSLRWLVGSGAVHQVEVAAGLRRRRVGSRLLVTAELLRAVHGWPPLSGGSDRTASGNALLGALTPFAPSRVEPWTVASAPGEAVPV